MTEQTRDRFKLAILIVFALIFPISLGASLTEHPAIALGGLLVQFLATAAICGVMLLVTRRVNAPTRSAQRGRGGPYL